MLYIVLLLFFSYIQCSVQTFCSGEGFSHLFTFTFNRKNKLNIYSKLCVVSRVLRAKRCLLMRWYLNMQEQIMLQT